MVTPFALMLEGDVRTPEQWRGIFRKADGTDFFAVLVEKAALKKAGQKTNLFRLDFVGIIAFDQTSVVCMPKIYDTSTSASDADNLSKIVRCIQRYQQRVRSGVRSSDTLDGESLFDDAGPMLNVFIALMAWTRDHGIHRTEATTISDAHSSINWPYTFDNATAIHLRTGPVYTDLYGFADTEFESRLGLIQSIALLELHATFGLVAELWASKFDAVLQQCAQVRRDSQFLPFHQEDMREAILDAELHTTRDHDRELVNLLRQWFDTKGDFNKGMRLFGVNAFHTIWEDMCSVALGAEHSAEQHSRVASQAQHLIGARTIELSGQRPDQLLLEGDRVWIVDAKWYRASHDEFPSLPDVVKQIMYGLTVTSDYTVAANCFLLPILGATVGLTRLGDTKMFFNGLADPRFPTVDIIGADWNAILERYLSNSESSSISSRLKAMFP